MTETKPGKLPLHWLMLIGFLMITNLFARLAGVIPGIGI